VESCARTTGRATARAPRLSTRNTQRHNGQSTVRRTTSGAAGNGLGTSIKYLRCTTSGAASNGLSRYQESFMCPFTSLTLHSPFLVRASFANTQNCTAKGDLIPESKTGFLAQPSPPGASIFATLLKCSYYTLVPHSSSHEDLVAFVDIPRSQLVQLFPLQHQSTSQP